MSDPNTQYPRFLLNTAILLVLVFIQPVELSLAEEHEGTPTIKDLIADEPSKNESKVEHVTKAIPADEFDRGTPRSSIQVLGQALNNRDYDLAMNYFDLRNVPPGIRRQGTELARQLKIIVDQSLWGDVDTISNDPKGHKDDGLPSYRDIIARLKTSDGPVDILMQRVPNGKGQYVWKLSNRTVADIPMLYEHFGYGKYGDKLSRTLPEYEFLGLETWQWVMLILIILIAFLISWLITYILNLFLHHRASKEKPYTHTRVFLAGPVRFLFFALLVRSSFNLLSPPYTFKAVIEAKTLLILAISWLVAGLVTLVFSRIGDRMQENNNEHATVLLRPVATLIKMVILLLALLTWLDNVGFNVTAILAGLGVGGIAIGLAAQKTIENLIGAITLYTAQPIRFGEFCRAGDTIGVVEEIGLRSTAIRTLDRTLVSIPNAILANMEIENVAKRDKILFRHTVRLRNDTTSDQIRSVLENVRKMFSEHPDVDPIPARIRFKEYGEHSLNLKIFAYIKTTDFNEYLASIEDINLRILDIIAKAGTQLALPVRSVRLEDEAVSV